MKKTVKLLFFCTVVILLWFLIEYLGATALNGGEGREEEKDKGRGNLTLNEYLHFEMLEERESIDLKGYGIKRYEIGNVMTEVLNSYPDLFFVRTEFTFSRDGEDVLSLFPEYSLKGRDREIAFLIFESELSDIISMIPNECRSDGDKLLFLHDYICNTFDYDNSYTVYDSYTFLQKGVGTCRAYTLLFMALLDRLNIENGFAYSSEMEHIWNTVKLDGHFYHIDVTWDDMGSRADYTYFLKSDVMFENMGHYIWQSEHRCESVRFDFLSSKETVQKELRRICCIASGSKCNHSMADRRLYMII